MINFRFHLASLIAVFLALALGIVMGSTVIDRAIVDSLRDRINRVENNADHQKSDNDQLRSTNGNLDDYIDQSAQYAVDGRLAGVPVVVIAGRGVNSKSLGQIQSMLQESGAQFGGTVWIEKKWQLSSKGDVTSLQSALHDSSKDKQSLRANGLHKLSDGVAHGTRDASVNDSLNALQTQGFISFKAPQGSAETFSALLNSHARTVVVSGPQDKTDPKLYLADLTGSLVQAGVATEVAEVFSNPAKNEDRSDLFNSLPKDNSTRQKIATINNAELTAGQVATVLALDDLGEGVANSYGFGSGAKRTVPEWFAQ